MWKIGNEANELDNLAKDASRQNLAKATWTLLAVSDEVLMERDELKNKWFIFLIKFGGYVEGRDHLCSRKRNLK